MNSPQPLSARARGFTLIEAILVIVIVGIIGAIVAVFIRAPVQGYADTAARAAASDEADLALRRMARDLRLALPNSVRVSDDGSAVEFLLTRTGGRYLTLDDDVEGFPVLDFDNENEHRFTAVGGTMRRIERGDFIVVYNLGGGASPSDAYEYRRNGIDNNIAMVVDVDESSADNPVITMESNPFARQTTTMRSPSNRFQVVTGPVSYACETAPDGSNVLARYWDYPIAAGQNLPPQGAPRRAVIATHVAACGQIFRYGSDITRRSALVIMNLALQLANDRDSRIRLVNQVHVDNTP
ncbi:prepilin-type N-terminal cleavage/methylation domain-containing protein [Massilia consociata]|uniref:Prepilin-type N-terminal cleavage/methylation domain-containing protein n=1 Tax=Massilia consociata TaxID=760117 RepID=A0ABV6FDV1_9BURK